MAEKEEYTLDVHLGGMHLSMFALALDPIRDGGQAADAIDIVGAQREEGANSVVVFDGPEIVASVGAALNGEKALGVEGEMGLEMKSPGLLLIGVANADLDEEGKALESSNIILQVAAELEHGHVEA